MCGLFSFFVGEILLQHVFIVLCLFGIFYLGLYYLYFSIKFDEVRRAISVVRDGWER